MLLSSVRVIKTSLSFKEKMQLSIVAIHLIAGNLLLSAIKHILYRSSSNPQRILVFRTGSIGDSVCAIPALQSIRNAYPSSGIDILTNTGREDLIGFSKLLDSSYYNDLINYSKYAKKELIHILKAKKYDLVIQLPQVDAGFFSLLRDLLIFRWISRSGFGWTFSQSRLFLKTQASCLLFINERERLNAILQKNGIAHTTYEPLLTLSKEIVERTRQLLANHGIKQLDNCIAVVTGAKRPQNRWPISSFLEVVKHFSSRYTFLLIGSEEDRERTQLFNSIDKVVNLCGELTPLESAAAISFCMLTISNDTGPMHLSYAVGTPTVALFSSRDLPGKWYPPERNNKVFRAKDIPCEGCFSETCSNNICVQSISQEEVIDAIEQIVNTDIISKNQV